MSKQKKLSSYFDIVMTYNDKKKTCFIYDPENCRAFFDYEPGEYDQFVVKYESNIRLFCRPVSQEYMIKHTPVFNAMRNFKPDVKSIPLLKSNLQKSIRRFNVHGAMSSAMGIIALNGTMELARRLGIIYVEDVCLIDHYPVSVWLMLAMSGHAYDPTSLDLYILVQIAGDLADTRRVLPHLRNEPLLKHKYATVDDIGTDNDVLKCVFIRSLYGGMMGDMCMLEECIDYMKTSKEPIEPGFTLGYYALPTKLTLLPVSVDFHPFPRMLDHISDATGEMKHLIKAFIWEAYSGVNLRKPDTIKKSEDALKQPIAKVINEEIRNYQSRGTKVTPF